jgi:hypothetical protein
LLDAAEVGSKLTYHSTGENRANFSLGVLVDDAIISIESMVVKIEDGRERINAASYAWSHRAAPMLDVAGLDTDWCL